MFLKKHPVLHAYLRGNIEPLIEAADRDDSWKTPGGLTPSLLAKHLLPTQKQALTIPAYGRRDGKLRFLTPAAFEHHFGVVYTDQLQFASFAILDDIAKRTKKQDQLSEARQMNKWTHALLLSQIRKEMTPPGAIKWINHELGYGVFAYKDLPEYTYIGRYTGQVRRRAPRKDQFNNYVFRYVCGTKNAPYVIDAREMGSFTRFINHSDTPNLTSRWIIVDGITHIVFFTNQFIKRGTQLTYDYGELYWRSRRHPRLL